MVSMKTVIEVTGQTKDRHEKPDIK